MPNFKAQTNESMASYLIVEDEQLAYEDILRMMRKLRPDYELRGWAEGVGRAVSLLQQGGIDLMIVDIHLQDGLSFEIFERCPADVPVIFTTAYDEYALKAFRVNSIDYLLKPVGESELADALCKFERRCALRSASPEYRRLEADYLSGRKKIRFLISMGNTFRHAATSDVAFFYSEEKYTYLYLFDGRKYPVSYSLNRLEGMLDETLFFRVSRNCIANIRSVQRVSRYFVGRLTVQLRPECPQPVVVSSSRAKDFLRWMDDMK